MKLKKIILWFGKGGCDFLNFPINFYPDLFIVIDLFFSKSPISNLRHYSTIFYSNSTIDDSTLTSTYYNVLITNTSILNTLHYYLPFYTSFMRCTSGWDRPPVLSSPSSPSSLDNRRNGKRNARECHWKTPQRLFTLNPNKSKDFNVGNSSCAPIIVYKKYILVANGMSISLYGNFDNEFPSTIVNTTTTSPLTQFLLWSEDDEDDAEKDGTGSSLTNTTATSRSYVVQMIFHKETGILYVLTVESCIFQIKLIIGQPNSNARENIDSNSRNKESLDDSDATSSKLPKFHRMHNWVTKKLGITCMATLHDGGGKGIDTVCVGYKSGYIEAFNVNSAYRTARSRHRKTDTLSSSSLQWEGYLDHSVRTLSFLFRSNEIQKECLTMETSGKDNEGTNDLKAKKSIRNDNIESVEKVKVYFLIAVVATNTRAADKGQQQTSSMLKILDLKRIMNETRKMDRNPIDITLQKYSLSPTHGMELIGVPKRVPILESFGADAACVLNSSCVGISFPDGTTSIITSDQNSINTVGVAEDNHQVLLSYPAIGNGQLDIIEDDGQILKYVATCLRGGTCYLIPVSGKSNTNDSIATIPFPHDIELDLSDIYVQAFTAGNIMFNGNVLPILVYVWPRGVVDVYACGLFYSNPNIGDESLTINDAHDDALVSREERRALQDLIDNDSLLLLSNILIELRDDSQHPLLQMNEWQQFLEETKTGQLLPVQVDKIDFDSMCSSQYQNFRRILLSLARAKE
jgi:hypothetical protein